MKYITFTLDNGDVYGLPLEAVAKIRADYYAKKDPETTFQDEYDFVMNDGYEGIDWFQNNQNPEDFTGQYVLIRPGTQKTLLERIGDAKEVEITTIGDAQ